MKWKILKPEEAKKFGVRTIDVGEDGYLTVNIAALPYGITPEKFIKNIVEQGIVIYIDVEDVKNSKS